MRTYGCELVLRRQKTESLRTATGLETARKATGDSCSVISFVKIPFQEEQNEPSLFSNEPGNSAGLRNDRGLQFIGSRTGCSRQLQGEMRHVPRRGRQGFGYGHEDGRP